MPLIYCTLVLTCIYWQAAAFDLIAGAFDSMAAAFNSIVDVSDWGGAFDAMAIVFDLIA